MRNQRFVVRYLDVTKDPRGLATAGVFIADPDLDQEFALSEPIAHDDWVPANLQLEKYQRNPVKQALDRLRGMFKPKIQDAPGVSPTDPFHGTVRLASALGDLLVGQIGSAPGPSGDSSNEGPTTGNGSGRDQGDGGKSRGTRGRRSRRGVSVEFTRVHRLLRDDAGAPVVEFDFELRRDDEVERVEVRAEPRVVIDGNTLEIPRDAPLGAEYPRVLGWRTSNGEFQATASVSIDADDPSHWSVRLTQPPDTAVSVALHAEPMPK
jgi:hypothetical protein